MIAVRRRIAGSLVAVLLVVACSSDGTDDPGDDPAALAPGEDDAANDANDADDADGDSGDEDGNQDEGSAADEPACWTPSRPVR